MAIFKDLALDGGVFAAQNENQRRVPALEVFDHPGVLHAVKLGKTGWGNEALRRMAERVFAAQDGGERPEVVGALGPEEVVGGDGGDGVVDYGGEDGYGGSGGKVGEERWVGSVREA